MSTDPEHRIEDGQRGKQAARGHLTKEGHEQNVWPPKD